MDAVARGAPVRIAVWVFHVGLPLLGLWLLAARPSLDVRWEHHASHFWLILAVAALAMVLAVLVDRAAARRGDARLLLVALAFLGSAGMFAVHAVATPGVVLHVPTIGFNAGTPIGLVVAAALCLASAARFTPSGAARVIAARVWLRFSVIGLVALCAVTTTLRVGPFGFRTGAAAHAVDDTSVHALNTVVAVVCVACFAVAAVRYWVSYRQRPAVVLLSVITAFALLAEAAVAAAVARNWQLSWWTWHLLLVAGFGFVAYSAYVQYQREGRAAGLFDSVGSEATVAAVRAEYGSALETLVTALQRSELGGTQDDVGRLAARMGERFGLSEGQTSVLGRAAESLAAERDQIRRLDALVAVGAECRVVLSEEELLRRCVPLVSAAFGPARVVPSGPGLPLTVKDATVGVLQVGSVSSDRELSVLRSLATQLSIGLENARLYRQIDLLFRQYLSPDVATSLLADPSASSLGGSLVEVSALFADLRGFTTFSEAATPAQIVAMLNDYFSAATRCVLTEGGTVVQFVGDAMMALFNAPARQPDHALRACAAALGMQRAVSRIRLDAPAWPQFRIGVNTGEALVGNIGGDQLRNFNAMGDAVNVAARLETLAEPGTVVIGGATLARLPRGTVADPLGTLPVKGRVAAVECHVLRALP